MTSAQLIITILALALGVQLTRHLAFLNFPEGREPPKVITYLGHMLPPATMGLLVVYCLKDVTWLSGSHGLPEILAILTVALLHGKFGNVLVSIAGGTAFYMLLVQAVF